MRVILFTEGMMRRDGAGHVHAVRDLYPRFIRRLAPLVGRLTMAARCERTASMSSAGQVLEEDEHFGFVGLPFYGSTADFYRRLAKLLPAFVPLIFRLVRTHDLVLLRLHNSLALWVLLAAKIYHRPLALYWAGPTIIDAVRRNYAGPSARDRGARFFARMEMRLHRILARLADANLFIDERQYETMGHPERTHWVVPSLIEPANVRSAPSPRGDGPLKLVFASRLVRHKGIFDVVEAVAVVRELSAASIRLDVAGTGPEEEKLWSRVSELGLRDIVDFRGHLPWSELQSLLHVSHVFILPSYAEGLPKVLWEAWAAGLALITSPVGSIDRYVEHGANGLLVPAGSVSDLSEAIMSLAGSEKLRQRLAEGGIRAARAHTWGEEIRSIGEVLSAIHGARTHSSLPGPTWHSPDR